MTVTVPVKFYYIQLYLVTLVPIGTKDWRQLGRMHIFFNSRVSREPPLKILLSYKSPSTDNNEFLEKLESFLLLLDPREPLYIIGDLNMDLKSIKGSDLGNFLIRNELNNFVNQHTRICRSYYKDKKKYQTSRTLIDVIISNIDPDPELDSDSNEELNLHSTKVNKFVQKKAYFFRSVFLNVA